MSGPLLDLLLIAVGIATVTGGAWADRRYDRFAVRVATLTVGVAFMAAGVGGLIAVTVA